jgi:hypothetical protein
MRWLVPWAPANWYADYAAAPDGLPIYGKGGFFQVSLLAAVLSWGGEPLLFAFNALLGSVVAALLYLAAKLLSNSSRAALTLAGLVTVAPFFVRLSSSDAPHVLVLACFVLALLAVSTWIRGRSWLGLAVAAASTLLAAPIRPDAIMGFWALPLVVIWAGGNLQSVWKRDRGALLVLGLAALAGSVPWGVHVLGQGGGQDFNFPDAGWMTILWLVASRAFGILTLWIADFSEPLMPWVFRIGYVAGWVVLILRRRTWDLSLLAFSLLVMSLPELAANFGGSLENLAIGRYMSLTAVVWMIPMAVAVEAAFGWIARARTQRLAWVAWTCCWLLAAGSSIRGYVEVPLYGQEHQFLREALPRDGTIVVLWGPSVAGVSDLNCCLALPSLLLARTRPRLRWLVVDPDDPEAVQKIASIERTHGTVFWYDGPLARMVPKSMEGIDQPACEAYLERARRLSEKVAAVGWDGPVGETEVTMDPGEKLSIFRLRDASGIDTVRIWRRLDGGSGGEVTSPTNHSLGAR